MSFVVFVIPSYLNLCLFQCFLCCFCYNLLSKSMCFPMLPLLFVGIPSYLNLGFSHVSFVVFVIPSYLNLCSFQCFLCCFRYTFLSKSMFFPILLGLALFGHFCIGGFLPVIFAFPRSYFLGILWPIRPLLVMLRGNLRTLRTRLSGTYHSTPCVPIPGLCFR